LITPSGGAEAAVDPRPQPAEPLPELATVYWRPRVTEESLARSARWWTLTTIGHTVPLVGVAVLLAVLNPITIPVGLVLLAHAWIIPELYAARGANVLRRRAAPASDAEQTALGLLGDLVGHDARELLARTGLALERAELGVWIVGEAGAVLVRPGGRGVFCYCVKATGDGLPPSDRIAHLLLALRADEAGFATVANLAFAGARWRLRRRLRGPGRAALDAAASA
jgi:hypothetical protein